MDNSVSEQSQQESVLEQNQYIDSLIEKWREKINPILEMDSDKQRPEFEKLGIDTDALMEYYREETLKSEELDKKNIEAGKRINLFTLISFAVTGVGILLFDSKHFVNSFQYKALCSFCGSITAAVGINFVTTNMLTGTIRKESVELQRKVRDIKLREAAVALENNEIANNANKNQPPEEPEKTRLFTDIVKQPSTI
ncbi:MAG: hypothetical protein WCJ33_08775, partial [Pseudomonadota bacterium]